MAAKKKNQGRVALRAQVMRARGLSEQLVATLAEAKAIVDSDGGDDLAEAVKVLRAIAGTSLDSDELPTTPGNDDAHKARWFRGHARGVLRRMGLSEKE